MLSIVELPRFLAGEAAWRTRTSKAQANAALNLTPVAARDSSENQPSTNRRDNHTHQREPDRHQPPINRPASPEAIHLERPLTACGRRIDAARNSGAAGHPPSTQNARASRTRLSHRQPPFTSSTNRSCASSPEGQPSITQSSAYGESITEITHPSLNSQQTNRQARQQQSPIKNRS